MSDKQIQDQTNIEQEINVLLLLQVLVQRKMFIIKACILAVFAAAAYSMTLPIIYSATAKILPPQKEATGGLSALLGQAGGLAGLAAGGLTGGSDLYVGILKSRSVADAVIKRPEIADGFKGQTSEEARRALERAVKVQAGKDGIITITAGATSPDRSALLANAFVEELGKTTVRLNLSKVGTERAFLEKRLALVKVDLKAAEDALKQFAQRNKVVQVDSQAKASIEGIARLKADLASKEVQLAVLSSKQTEQSPEVKAAQAGIRRLRAELGALAGGNSGGEGIPSIGDVPGVGLEYARKLRELKTQEAIFEQLTKQYEVAKINEAKDSSSFQILDEAVTPLSRTSPRRTLIVMLAALAALVASVLVVFAQEFISKLPENDRKILENIKKQALSLR